MMNYIKSIIAKDDYKKVQRFNGKFLCLLCPTENEDGSLIVAQVLVDTEPDEVDFLKMEAVYRSEEEKLLKQERIRILKERTTGLNSELIEALERLIAEHGITEQDRIHAQERIILRDELGKLVQTQEGDGTDANPYKGWTVGMAVESEKWYMTEDGYLWEAKKDGYPVSTTDDLFFDVVGV